MVIDFLKEKEKRKEMQKAETLKSVLNKEPLSDRNLTIEKMVKDALGIRWLNMKPSFTFGKINTESLPDPFPPDQPPPSAA